MLTRSQKTHPFKRTYCKHRTLEAFVSRTLFYTTHQYPLSETLELILEQFPWKAADGTSSTRNSSNKFVKKAKKKTEKTCFHTTIFVACTQTMFHFSVRSSFFSKTLASTRAKQDAPTPIPLCWRSINPLGFLLLDVFWRKNRGYVIRLPYLQDNNYFGSAWTSQVKKVNCNVNEISINCESCNN